jgi:hypothetical protein
MSASLFQSGLFNGQVEKEIKILLKSLLLLLLFYFSVEVLERQDYHHLLVVQLQQEN